MIYTEEQLFDLVLPIIATVSEKDITNSEVIQATSAIVEIIKQDREAHEPEEEE